MGWSEEMDRKAEAMRTDPEKYFREVRAKYKAEDSVMRSIRDFFVLWWVRLTECRKYGHMPWEEGPGSYCRNCGKVNK